LNTPITIFIFTGHHTPQIRHQGKYNAPLPLRRCCFFAAAAAKMLLMPLRERDASLCRCRLPPRCCAPRAMPPCQRERAMPAAMRRVLLSLLADAAATIDTFAGAPSASAEHYITIPTHHQVTIPTYHTKVKIRIYTTLYHTFHFTKIIINTITLHCSSSHTHNINT
jgi:hypothetical protein